MIINCAQVLNTGLIQSLHTLKVNTHAYHFTIHLLLWNKFQVDETKDKYSFRLGTKLFRPIAVRCFGHFFLNSRS